MNKTIKLSAIVLLCVLAYACAIVSKDNFLYLGHPSSFPDYNVYYDKVEKNYLFIDKDGCFDKSASGSGTCMALNHKEANNFVENILPKMLDRRSRILEKHSKEKIIAYLKESKRKAVIKVIDTTGIKVMPVKEIEVDGKDEYHLVSRKYNVKVNLKIMLDASKQDNNLRVLYSLRMPGVINTPYKSLKPFMLDPEFLNKVMNKKYIKSAEQKQEENLEQRKKEKQKFKELNHYLDNDLEVK
ncbi:hypothetical protein CDV26_08300 [Francisella halioticida]|uniref:Lipoprotein n=1 Tax=Francisella halioticida TaxID=549298 RepID=A0ABN5AWV6_9GAMM|nr:hypothetical protein [Francisella halioticida]ASG68389.1 hypothetical protein CDV26_08300 [Francisella halioticida]